MPNVKIGKISHYFDKIGVAVVEVEDESLSVGDNIKIIGHGQEIDQVVESMQIEHEAVQTAEKGMSVGMKVTEPVKKDAEVFKVV